MLCLACGVLIIQRGPRKGRPRAYCSSRCQRRAQKQRRAERDATGISWTPPEPSITPNSCKLAQCSDCGALLPGKPCGRPKCDNCRGRICEICGKRFRPRARSGETQRTCSRACGAKLRRYITGTLPPFRFPIAYGAACTLYWVDCIGCGKQFISRSPTGKICKQCKDLAPANPYYWYGRRSEELKPLPTTVVCHNCGVTFEPTRSPRQGQPRKTFCSRICCKRYYRTSRSLSKRIKAFGYRESISHLDIANRDGWRCHLCGKLVHRRDWSLDHLVPLSRGGLHQRQNVALAHHYCNTIRSNSLLSAAHIEQVVASWSN